MSYIPRRIPERGRMHRLGFFRSSSFNSFNGLILITLHVVRLLFIAFFKGVLHYVRANNILNIRFNHSHNLQLVICNIMIKKADKIYFRLFCFRNKNSRFSSTGLQYDTKKRNYFRIKTIANTLSAMQIILYVTID